MELIKYEDLSAEAVASLTQSIKKELILEHEKMGIDPPSLQRINERLEIESRKNFTEINGRYFQVNYRKLF